MVRSLLLLFLSFQTTYATEFTIRVRASKDGYLQKLAVRHDPDGSKLITANVEVDEKEVTLHVQERDPRAFSNALREFSFPLVAFISGIRITEVHITAMQAFDEGLALHSTETWQTGSRNEFIYFIPWDHFEDETRGALMIPVHAIGDSPPTARAQIILGTNSEGALAWNTLVISDDSGTHSSTIADTYTNVSILGTWRLNQQTLAIHTRHVKTCENAPIPCRPGVHNYVVIFRNRGTSSSPTFTVIPAQSDAGNEVELR